MRQTTEFAKPDLLEFLVAARRCEVDGLEQMAHAVHLVSVVRALVHALQRERGASILFLGGKGDRYLERLKMYQDDSDRVRQDFLAHLSSWRAPEQRSLQCSRVLGGVALALHGLSRLATLRAGVVGGETRAAKVLDRYSELLRELFAVVFEAADAVVDPEFSRALIGLFNLMQGKEIAGQERAIGAAGFSSGWTEEPLRQALVQRIHAQERCLEIFAEFCDPQSLSMWKESLGSEHTVEVERLRRMACTAPPGQPEEVSRDLAELWFAQTTARIDSLHGIEENMERGLRGLCERRLADAREALAETSAVRNGPGKRVSEAAAEPAGMLLGKPLQYGEWNDADVVSLLELERRRISAEGAMLQSSLMDLVHTQSQQLHAISDELRAAREALAERKLVERAKALLMKHRQLTEEQAYQLLRQTAMNQGRRLAEVAAATVALEDVLAS